MKSVANKEVGEKVCEALGLDPRAVESLNIEVERKHLTVYAKLIYFTPEKVDKVIEVLDARKS